MNWYCLSHSMDPSPRKRGVISHGFIGLGGFTSTEPIQLDRSLSKADSAVVGYLRSLLLANGEREKTMALLIINQG